MKKIKQFGRATYKNGKMYFDNEAWSLIKGLARSTHQSPTTLVHAALRRYIRSHKNGK